MIIEPHISFLDEVYKFKSYEQPTTIEKIDYAHSKLNKLIEKIFIESKMELCETVHKDRTTSFCS
jgi:hypothetical protein